MIRRRALLSLIEYKQIEPSIHNNKIWYTSSNGNVVTPYYKDFGANIISNEYNNGKGVITFDGEVTMISDYAFFDCSSLTSVTIGDSVTTIGDDAFNDCYSLTNVTIGDSVTTIGERAFFECSSLTSVTIPDSVTTIGNESFAYCNSLTSVTIGDSVITIGNYAFYGCVSLTSITIPNSVTTIGDGAFDDCDDLTSVYCEATTPPALGGTYVFDSNGSGRKIYVPTASVETYKIADGWSEYADAIVGYDFENESMNLISFTVAGIEYQAEEGMTWEEFCNSEYNIDSFQIIEATGGSDSQIFCGGASHVGLGSTVYDGHVSKDDLIINNYTYYSISAEPI